MAAGQVFIARRGKDRELYVADKWFKVKHGFDRPR